MSWHRIVISSTWTWYNRTQNSWNCSVHKLRVLCLIHSPYTPRIVVQPSQFCAVVVIYLSTIIIIVLSSRDDNDTPRLKEKKNREMDYVSKTFVKQF